MAALPEYDKQPFLQIWNNKMSSSQYSISPLSAYSNVHAPEGIWEPLALGTAMEGAAL